VLTIFDSCLPFFAIRTNECNVVLYGITGEAGVVVNTTKSGNAREDRVGL